MKTVTGMGGMGGARELAEMLRQMGRGRDTVLAHITPEEAQMLMDMGGSGNMNPNTGLPEFQQEDYFGPEFTQDYSGFAQDESYKGIPQAGQPVFDAGFDPFAGMPAQPAQGPMMQPGLDLGEAVTAQQSMDMYGGQPMTYADITSPATRGDISAYFGGQPEGQPGFLQTAAQGIEDSAAQYRQLAREYPTVAKMLSTGATTLPALIQAIRARRAGEKSAAQFRELGAPLRAQGEALRTQALAGQLTPQQAAQQEAARARLRQGAAGRGATTGTQAGMIETQLARQRAQLSETNLNNALKQLNLANAYDEAAIKAKIASDQEIESALANIFANLGRDVTSQAPAQQPRQTAGLASQPEITRRPDVRG